MKDETIINGIFGKNKERRDFILSYITSAILAIIFLISCFVFSEPVYGDEYIPSTTRAVGLTRNVISYKPNIICLIITIVFVICFIYYIVRARFSYYKKSNQALQITERKVIARINQQTIIFPTNQIFSYKAEKKQGSLIIELPGQSYSFYYLENREKVIEVLANLIDQSTASPYHCDEKTDADFSKELIKFKDLLDNGVITQEEFDAKKKQLLDL